MAAAGAVAAIATPAARATDGTWSSATSGSWGDPSKWLGGTIADAGGIANFNTVDIVGDVTVTLDTARSLATLNFSDTVTSTTGRWIISDGGNLANTLTLSGNANVTQGTVSLTGTLSLAALNVSAGGSGNPSPVFSVDGGTLTASAQSTINAGTASGQFILNSGSATFNGGLRTSNNDSAVIKVTGGTLTASDLNVQRNSAGTVSFTSGLVFTGGTVNAGTITLGSNNSNGAMSVEGTANVTASGQVTIGRQVTASRGGALRVIGGTFTSTDTVNGVVLVQQNGTSTVNQTATATFSGGISTVEKFTMGFDANSTGSGTINVSGGTLYIGSGGIVKNGPSNYTSTINLSSGTLGAKADWSTDQPITLSTGGNVTIKAADAANAAHNIAFSGIVAGSGNINKIGAGTLTLSGANTYTGSVTVTEGTLAGTTSGIRGNIANSGTVNFNQTTSGTYGGVISGSGALTKSGSGSVTLSSAQTYTGATTISGGTLAINGTQGTSGVSVQNGAALALAGNATVSTLTLGSAGGDAMTLRVNGGAALNSLAVSANNGLVTNGTTTIDVGTVGLTVGPHVLVDYSGSIGGSGFGGFVLGTLPPRIVANLANNTGNTSVDLNVTAIDIPRWNGNLSGAWDINTTANWKEATSGNTTTYLENSVPGDQVLFNDAAAGTTTVDVTTTVQPLFVTVDNTTKNYTFTGAGKISGATGLIKQGTGTLTVGNTGGNDYSGATTLSAGTIALGADNVLSDNSAITINGGTLDVNSHFDTSGNVTLASGTIAGTSGLLSAPGYDLQSGTVTVNLGGSGSLLKTTGGSVSLNTAASYGGSTQVQNGTLQIGVDHALPTQSSLTVGNLNTSGTLELNGHNQSIAIISTSGTGTSNTIANSAGGPAVTLTINGGPTFSASGTFAGAINGNLALQMSSLGTLTLTGTSTFTGGTTIDNGGIVVINGDAALGSAPASPTNNITFNNVGGTLRAGAASVVLNANRSIFIDGVTATFDSGGGSNTMTINGVISGSHVAKGGNGTVILTNANTYGGNTTITAGNLRASNNSAFSTSTIRITGSTASLQLDNGITLTNNLISQSNSDNLVDVPVAGGNATFAGNVSIETGGGGNQYRVAATGSGATLTLTGSAVLPNTFVANQGNIIMSGSSSIVATGGSANALLARPGGAANLNFTLKDNATAAFDGFTDLGNARNVGDATLTIQDSASYSTGTTFNLLDTTNTSGTSTVNLNGGTLTVGSFLKSSTGASQTATISFNGGALRPIATNAAFLPALTGAVGKVKNGGVIIDTNGFDVAVAIPLQADGTGGLAKNGAGALTISGANTYTGPTVVNAGSLALGSNLTTSSSVSINNSSTVQIQQSGSFNRVIKTGNVTIGAGSKLNIENNKLILTGQGVGSWNGTAYTGVTGLIASGYGPNQDFGGTTGIVTTQSNATGGNTLNNIGVASNSDLGLATFGGVSVGANDTLAMFTYGGDANLDGAITGDDYFQIDSGFPAGAHGWFNGDFNYDGSITGDDYFVIDSNFSAQGTPIPTSGGIGGGTALAGVQAVPEPASIGLIGLGATASLARRRPRRRRRK